MVHDLYYLAAIEGYDCVMTVRAFVKHMQNLPVSLMYHKSKILITCTCNTAMGLPDVQLISPNKIDLKLHRVDGTLDWTSELHVDSTLALGNYKCIFVNKTTVSHQIAYRLCEIFYVLLHTVYYYVL